MVGKKKRILLLLILNLPSNERDPRKKWMNILGEINKNNKTIKLSIIRNQNNEDSLAMAVKTQRNRQEDHCWSSFENQRKKVNIEEAIIDAAMLLLDSKGSKTCCHGRIRSKAREEGSVVLNKFNFRKKTNVVVVRVFNNGFLFCKIRVSGKENKEDDGEQ